MAIVRQMAELYLRGSLANVTMKNLTSDQVRFAEELTERVVSTPGMNKHRFKVKRIFAETISADYHNDSETADQEYRIAVWRGVVNLFFHKHYKLHCKSCGATHRHVKTTGQMKPFDQAHTPCPVCNKIKVDDPGDTDYQAGEYVDEAEFNRSYQDFIEGIPTYSSTIVATPGGGATKEQLDELLEKGEISTDVYLRRLEQYRYDDPYAIIDDPEQLVKFFGEFVWGYFRQQIRENKRQEHKRPTQIVGRADEVIVQEILASASKLKIPVNFCPKTQPEDGWWNIGVIGLQTPPEFTGELIPIFARAHEHDIRVCITPTLIKIEHNTNSPYIQALVTKSEHVLVLDANQSVSDDSENAPKFSLEHISFKTIEGNKVELIEHTELIDRHDTMRAIEERLPEGDCRKIFQIIQQEGESYNEFRNSYNYDSEPRQAHIARHLKITPRSVKNHIAVIKLACLSQGFGPSDLK